MRAVLIALLLTTPGLVGPAGAAVPAKHPSYGVWHNPANSVHVAAKPCGDKMCGRVDRLLIKQPAGGQLDERNPDKAKRSRKVTGLQIYWDLVPHGDGWKGEGYSTEDGRYYKAHLRANGGKMTMKGCVSLFCRTVTWTKMS